jgi:hypothetical protein
MKNKKRIKLKLHDVAGMMVKVKGKAIPLQAWTSLQCSRRLRLP